jgi:hypothetical protein
MKTRNFLFIAYISLAFTGTTVFSQNVKAIPKKKRGTPKRYEYKDPKTPSLGTANKVPSKKTVVKKTGGGPTINTNPNNRPPNSNTKNARRRCRLCTQTWSVPNPSLVLLDETCSYWNNRDIPLESCSNVQATYGSACGCPNAPKPVCDVCPYGDYVWKEAPQFNTFTDDFCVRMIYRMSKRTEFCDGNKRRVASMCCSNTCSRRDGAPSRSSQKAGNKLLKQYGGKKEQKSDDKSSKTSKSNRKKSKDDRVPPGNQDYYYEGPYYQDYYYEEPDPYYQDYYYEGPDPYYYYYYRGAPSRSSRKVGSKLLKNYGGKKEEQKSGDDKSSKTSKSNRKKSKDDRVPPGNQDYYYEGPDLYYPDYYYEGPDPYYYYYR